MQFSRLRLSGFKSFVDPVDLPILPGLTGIVGPNGCGKSNLLEALRWVMGENSPKSMRAGGMDDVIFNGTSRRPPRNLADVALLVDEPRAVAGLGVEDDQIEITRRIERGAGSAYRINGKDVRAQDVRLLFADAATGAHSPALVSQGRIGALVTAKPAERRAILEEAAGVAGLHSRRVEAEKKLRAAEANLARVQDVLTQLDGRIGQLTRQARQAARYKALSARIDQAEAAKLYRTWWAAAQACEAQQKALSEATQAVARLTTAATEAERLKEDSEAGLHPLRQAQVEAAAALQRLTLMREKLAEEETRRRDAFEKAERLLADLARDETRESEALADADQALARLSEEAEALKTAEASAEAVLDKAKAALDQALAQAHEAEAAYDRDNEALVGARTRRASLMSDLSAVERRADRLIREKQELTARRDRLAADAGPDPAKTQPAVEAADQAREAAQQRCDAAAAVIEQRKAELEAATAAFNAADDSVRRLEAERTGLQTLVAAAEKKTGKTEPVLAQIEVAPGYEAALGAAFAETLKTGTDPAQPAHWAGAAPQPGDPPLPDGVPALADYVRAPDALARALAQIGLVDQPSEAAALMPRLATGQRLVSREGHLWRWDGYCRRADAPSAAAVELQQRNRLAALKAERSAAEAQAEERRAVQQAAQQALQAAQQAERAAREARSVAEKGLAQARQAHLEAERAQAKRAGQQASLAAQAERLDRDAVEAQSRVAEVRSKLDGLPDLTSLDAAVQDRRRAVDAARGTLADARARADALGRDRSLRQNRLAAIGQEQAQWKKRRAGAERQLASLSERRRAAEEERQLHAGAPAELEQKRLALAGDIEAAQHAASAAADRLAEAETAHKQALARLKESEAALARAREERVRLETQTENAEAQRKDLAQQCGARYRCPPPALPDKQGFSADQAADLAGALEGLIKDRERLGAVNLQAAEELQTVEAEKTALAEQRGDLEQAIARLRGAIGALNREGRERLLAAFDEVNRHFADLFTTLFGGGEAHLKLVDSDDPLAAGLEILASPPGKRLQSLSLLSGGEQALTALSLIFAVFMTNPAPICVLDEVDAPLDDANVERFCDLLDHMVARTQTRFLIVTHNAVTMARVARLFGVTMAEKGVSTLVSVDLAQADALAATG